MISLSAPQIGAAGREAVNRVLDSGMLAQGPDVAAFESEFSAMAGAAHSVVVNAGRNHIDPESFADAVVAVLGQAMQ